jgi:hypothetical protein
MLADIIRPFPTFSEIGLGAERVGAGEALRRENAAARQLYAA